MQIVPLCFGVACMGSVALARYSDKKDRGDAVFIGVVLVAAWAVSNVAWLTNSLEKLALMDGGIAALSALIYRLRGGNWRLWFAGLAIAQLGLDVLYGWFGTEYVVPYLWAYDLTFAGEILAVAWKGGGNVLERPWRSYVRSSFLLLSRNMQSAA
jgi:hypothetical protein